MVADLSLLRDTSRVAVLRALPGLGDFLCVTPALRALREALPEAHVTLIGLPWLSSLSPRYKLWDAFVPFPGAPGLPEVPFEQARSARFRTAYRGAFDAVLQLHGSGLESNAFALELDAPVTAGFHPEGKASPGPHFLPWREDEPEVTRWLRVLSHLGISAQGTQLGFPLEPDDAARAAGVRLEHDLTDFLILHPGAADAAKRWPVENFAAVGREAQRLGLQVVITGGEGEVSLARRLYEQLPGSLNLCGATDLGTLAALLADSRLLVCNDTGVSHLAAATRTPSVVLFRATDPARWAPLDRARHVALQTTDVGAVLDALRTHLGNGGTYEHPDLARPRGVPVLPDA